MSSSGSDSDDIPLTKRQKSPKRKHFDLTSSLNRYVMCHDCGRQFACKYALAKHLTHCLAREVALICPWCKLEFSNRGNLSTHAYLLHGDASFKKILPLKYCCEICTKSFNDLRTLTYHIRREHFNLKAKIPYAEMKKVNQVWFENVLNSNKVIEIRKTGLNTLVMRKLSDNTAVKVNNENTNFIDLSHIYPTSKSLREPQKIKCDYCNKLYIKKDIKKHIDEVHLHKNKVICNNCNRQFKRMYHYLKHVCNKRRYIRGVKQCKNEMTVQIASVTSLAPPTITID